MSTDVELIERLRNVRRLDPGGTELLREPWAMEAADRLAALLEERDRFKEALTTNDMVTAICKRVAELPDRSSPDDWPEAMLVTYDELEFIIVDELLDALSTTQPKGDAT